LTKAAESVNGVDTWVELISIIDEELRHAGRLDALKATFMK